MLFHHDALALLAEFDASHEIAHQQHAPAGGAFEIFIGRRVGKLIGIEAGPFIDDLDPEFLSRHPAGNAHLFRRVVPIAMLDGVDDCFFHREMNAKDIARCPLRVFQPRAHLLDDILSRGLRAGNGDAD